MTKLAAKSNNDIETEETKDPVLLMLGVGKQAWERESGDKFVERLRSEDEVLSIFEPPGSDHIENSPESVWRRIQQHQGEEFRTATQLPFRYEVEGTGIWFFRNGRRINRKLTRSQLERAIERCPLSSTTEIKDLMDYAYLFGVLMDTRIRRQAW